MKERSKLSEVDIFAGSKNKPGTKSPQKRPAKPKEPYITKSFRLPVDMAQKLKEYAANMGPKHLKVTESEVLRYMIVNFDLEEAKKNFFQVD